MSTKSSKFSISFVSEYLLMIKMISWKRTCHLDYCLIFCYLFRFIVGDELVLVQLLMRHGDRTPSKLYPNDNNTADTWPQGLGQLTKLGIKQQYNVGKYLRKRYVEDFNHLSPSYQRKELTVQSTNIDRTLMSAMCTLQGLYPERESALWDPIPVHTKDFQHDIMLNPEVPCEKYNDDLNAVLRTSYGTQYVNENRNFIHDVCLAAGWENASLWNVCDTGDAIGVEATHNRSLPKWATKPVQNKLKEAYIQKLKLLFHTEDQRKIKAGVFLTEICNKTKAKISGDLQDSKMFMYMSHDEMLTAVLAALGVWDQRQPPLSSIIFFELYKTPDNTYKITVRYKNNNNDDPTVDPVTLLLPECAEPCPINQFCQQVEPLMIANEEAWIAYCEYWGEGQITKGGIVAVSIFCALFFIGLVVLFYWCYRHQQAEVRYLPANYGVGSNM